MGDTTVRVYPLPKCDVCKDYGQIIEAYADARMRTGGWKGSWAYLCKMHFEEFGCTLGLGFGQTFEKEI